MGASTAVSRWPHRKTRRWAAPAAGLLPVLVACATTSSGTRVEAPYLHPALAHPDRPLAALSSFRVTASGSATTTRSAARPRPARPAVPAPRRPVAMTSPLEFPDAAGDVDLRRAEVVRSARRVLGVTGSFDDRSFLGHILRVNDLLPEGERPESVSALEFQRLAESRGRVVGLDAALPGDLVLFPCDGDCGPAGRDGLAAGVIERTYEDRVEFIAYVGSAVRACHSGGSRPRLPSRQVREVVGVISIAPRPASAEAPQR